MGRADEEKRLDSLLLAPEMCIKLGENVKELKKRAQATVFSLGIIRKKQLF